MLTVKLHKTGSPKNKVKKVLDSGLSFSCCLKEDCSILEPTLDIFTDSDITACNYLYIQDFGRYYFIDDIVSTNNGYWTIRAHVDVLMTYQMEILGNQAVISRQQHKYNTYLNDPEWCVYAYDDVITFKFTDSEFTKSLEYVLTVAGGV